MERLRATMQFAGFGAALLVPYGVAFLVTADWEHPEQAVLLPLSVVAAGAVFGGAIGAATGHTV